MRKAMETLLILMVCLAPQFNIEYISQNIPFILISLIFSIVLYNLKEPIYIYIITGVFFLFSYFFPGLIYFSPLIVYGTLTVTIIPSFLASFIILYGTKIFLFIPLILAIYLAYVEKIDSNRQEEFLRTRDTYKENEILQLKIRQEIDRNSAINLELAVLDERNRISRELHDSIGHTLSSSLLQIEALKYSSDEKSKVKLNSISEVLSKGMTEIRTTIHNLHNESVPLSTIFKNLVVSMEEKYIIDLQIQVSDNIPMNIKKAFESVLKESLTNIRKHSRGNEIKVLARELPMHYTLTVKDNGDESPNFKPGMGLLNMRDIASSFGGIFSHGYENGFYTHITIPKEVKKDEINNN